MSQATDQYNAAVRRYEIAEQRIAELEAALKSAKAVLKVDDEYNLYDIVCNALKETP